ncbi:MAG: hypothetical protein K9H62_09995 [Bacteroidales bacterium]|nr:hypothetical protein [Bacteroidales bacterium]
MGSESFESIITGLDINTEYYVRAFAINSDGPGYGNQEVFTTSDYVDSVYVNFTIAVFDPEYAALLVPGNSITVIGGANGILIYRISDTDFAAYDRTCTYPVEENCQVKVDNSGVFAVDTLCCKSKYLLLDGSVVRGPATYPLKSYRTSFDGTYLRVFN